MVVAGEGGFLLREKLTEFNTQWSRQTKTIFAGGYGFALPRLILIWDWVSAVQEGAGGMHGGSFSDFLAGGGYTNESLINLLYLSTFTFNSIFSFSSEPECDGRLTL